VGIAVNVVLRPVMPVWRNGNAHKRRALTIDEVRARFEEWRKNRHGKSPIPDELWSAAAELARNDGINRTQLLDWSRVPRSCHSRNLFKNSS